MQASSSSDTAVLGGTFLVLCGVIYVLRQLLPRFLRVYTEIPPTEQYEVLRRLVHFFGQLVTCTCHIRILIHTPYYANDVLYGYSDFAHKAFLLTIGVFLVDTLLFIAHPFPTSQSSAWILHHTLSLGLLIWDVSCLRRSAFPAAIFLVSNIGHFLNDIRWILIVTDVRGPLINTALNVTAGILIFFALVLPPPYLVILAARGRDMSVSSFMLQKMRLYCWVFSLAFYIPHLIIPFYQVNRIWKNWMIPAERYRLAAKDN